jgi:hypothetical protein
LRCRDGSSAIATSLPPTSCASSTSVALGRRRDAPITSHRARSRQRRERPDAHFAPHALDTRRDTGHKARTMPTKPRAKTAKRVTKAAPRKKTATPRAGAKTAKSTRAAATTVATAIVPARRAVFIDVENTSSESELVRVLDELKIDLTSGATDVTAIGNWRVVGQQLGRSLAQRGAHLVHSAPATRVPDWSDLWIAVQAGIWLGRSRPGDSIDIVSHDRAFDAVGDAAARLGVSFTRITYRTAHPHAAAAERTAEPPGERRRRRRRRGGSGRAAGSHAAATGPAAASAAHATTAEPQAAPSEQLEQVIARLAANDPAHTVTLDALTVALKAAGFQRPPGSPRLVTRLRRMKDVEVLPNGRVRLNPAAEATAAHALAEPLAEPAAAAADEATSDDGSEHDAAENGTSAEGATKRRSRRRGGRRRGGRGRKGTASSSAPPAE